MTITTPYPNAPDVSASHYVVVGLATCFIKDEEGVHEVTVAEPIPSAALEAILKKIPTSYQLVTATTVGSILVENQGRVPEGFPAHTQLCDEFESRVIAAARTYHTHPTAQTYIPMGTSRNDFNFSTERKRVLNSERIVRSEDNVKQHEYTHKVL